MCANTDYGVANSTDSHIFVQEVERDARLMQPVV